MTEVEAAGAGADDRIDVVVLIHGALDRATSFGRTVRRLDDLHVVVYDRRGYEHSRPAGMAAGLSDHVDDLFEVIDDRSAVVIGHSYGGDVALSAAVREPAVIRGVGCYEPPLPWVDWWPRRPPGEWPPPDAATFAESFFSRVAGADAWLRLTETQREERRADGPALVAEMADLRRAEVAIPLELVRVPTTAGMGERSRPHHRAASKHVAATVPDADLVEIAGAAHGAHLTHPDGFARYVRHVVRRANQPTDGTV